MRKIILSALLLAALAVLPFTGPSLPPRPAPAFVPTADEREKLAFYRQPEQWFIEHLAGPREVIDGQTLDPKLQYMMEQLRPHRWLINHGIPLIFSTPAGRRWRSIRRTALARRRWIVRSSGSKLRGADEKSRIGERTWPMPSKPPAPTRISASRCSSGRACSSPARSSKAEARKHSIPVAPETHTHL